MTKETVHLVQGFITGKGGRLIAEKPVQCKDVEAARRMAMRIASTKHGVVAYTTSGDAETGDYDDQPTIIYRAGELSAQFED